MVLDWITVNTKMLIFFLCNSAHKAQSRSITRKYSLYHLYQCVMFSSLKLELENNFFHNHSPSLKKTVEFISNRIASNCIKSIDATLVSDARKAVVVMVTQLVQDGCGDVMSSSNAKNALLQKARNKCVEMSSRVKEEAHQVAAK